MAVGPGLRTLFSAYQGCLQYDCEHLMVFFVPGPNVNWLVIIKSSNLGESGGFEPGIFDCKSVVLSRSHGGFANILKKLLFKLNGIT